MNKSILICILLVVFSRSCFAVTTAQMKVETDKRIVKMSEAKQDRLDAKYGPAPVLVSPDKIPQEYLPQKVEKTVKKTDNLNDKLKQKKIYGSPLQSSLAVGMYANIPGISLALNWRKPFGFSGTELKTGIMYAQGEDSEKVLRKNALIFADGILEITPLSLDGVGSYIGGGFNYLAYTTGKVVGIVGGELYIGMQSQMDKKNITFVELGYGAIRTGFSPSFKGLHAIIGMKSIF